MLYEICPIGGLGQIGSNMTLVKTPSEEIIIDCGILFPSEDFFDISYLIPDFLSMQINPDHLVITHGHEDHIGAIAHFLDVFPNVKISAPLFAAELIRYKLAEKNISKKINIFNESDQLKFIDIDMHPIHVNHSIPDTFGILIQDKNKLSSTFFVSDFKYDLNSPYEAPFNLKKLEKLSKDCEIKILFADSTNILNPGKTLSELDVYEGLKKTINNCKKRIFLTSFSSNIHRIQSVFKIAHETNKLVIPYGRSMLKYISIAEKADYLNTYGLLRETKQIDTNSDNIIVLLTGCQGDFRGALRRVTSGADSSFRLKPSDSFIFSSKTIPGNEKKIGQIYNKISEAGCSLFIDNKKNNIHASGHPGQEDLKTIYESYSPTHFIPIHGESYFLEEHISFIKRTFPQVCPYLMYNFNSIILNEDLTLRSKENNSYDPILIHGKGIEIERSAISERRKLANNGLVVVSVNITDYKNNLCKFSFDFKGLPNLVENNRDEFNSFLLTQTKLIKMKDYTRFSEELRISVRKYFNASLGYKPLTIIHTL
jgi:ribonuclease J